ncbi:MAG: energy transducer TonB [Smithellaceae bacterium]
MDGLNKDKISAVCISLVLHLLAVAMLIPGFFGEGLLHAFARDKVDYFWVSIGPVNGEDAPAVPGEKAIASVPAAVVQPPAASLSEHLQAQSSVKPEPAQAQAQDETSVAAGDSETVSDSAPSFFAATATTAAHESGHAKGSLSGSVGAHAGPEGVLPSALPLYRENAPPPYPEIARVRGYQGVVLVAAEVLPDGTVGKTKIKKSSGYAILDQTAVKAVKPWRFRPAVKEGRPFAVWVELPINFQLRENSSI